MLGVGRAWANSAGGGMGTVWQPVTRASVARRAMSLNIDMANGGDVGPEGRDGAVLGFDFVPTGIG